MANRLKGITVEIGGDITKLQAALQGVNSEIRNTQAQLKDVEKLLKLDPGNIELIARKQRLLGEAVAATKEKLEALQRAQEQATQALSNGNGPFNQCFLKNRFLLCFMMRSPSILAACGGMVYKCCIRMIL